MIDDEDYRFQFGDWIPFQQTQLTKGETRHGSR